MIPDFPRNFATSAFRAGVAKDEASKILERSASKARH